MAIDRIDKTRLSFLRKTYKMLEKSGIAEMESAKIHKKQAKKRSCKTEIWQNSQNFLNLYKFHKIFLGFLGETPVEIWDKIL